MSPPSSCSLFPSSQRVAERHDNAITGLQSLHGLQKQESGWKPTFPRDVLPGDEQALPRPAEGAPPGVSDAPVVRQDGNICHQPGNQTRAAATLGKDHDELGADLLCGAAGREGYGYVRAAILQGVCQKADAGFCSARPRPRQCCRDKRTLSRGCLPTALSAESITASSTCQIALATSLASALVGCGFSIMLSSIWVG